MSLKKMLVSLFLVFLSVGTRGTHTTDDHEAFTVSIITSPREGPFRIRQQVNFSCAVDPAPPDNVTYQWRSVDSVYGGNSYSQQNFSYSYYYSNLRYCWYFCKVMMNQTLVGSSSRLVELSGFIYPNSPVVRSYIQGGSIVLNVNISDNYYANYISLAWYHNGTRVHSNGKINIFNNNTSLSVSNMEEENAGLYEVKIDSYDAQERRGYSNDPECDLLVLPLLQSLASFAPVTFRVQQNSVPQYNPLEVVSMFTLQEAEEHIVELRSVAYVNVTQLSQYEYVERYWYKNGQRLANSIMYNTSFFDTNTSFLQLAYNHSSEAIGEYVGVQYTYIYALSYIQCRGYYYWLDYDIGIYYLPLSLSYWKIRIPRRMISLIIQQSVIEKGKSTTVSCTSTSAFHDETNLTLWRNNELVAQVQGNRLNHSTTPYIYGSYQCFSGNAIHSNVSILQERVHFQVLMHDNEQCGVLQYQQNDILKVALGNVFSSLCLSCDDISTSNIQNVQVNCSEFMYITADLVYSDPAGRITASTLLDMFSTWMLSQENPSLLVNGQTLSLIRECPLEMNAVTADNCAEYASHRPVDFIPSITGAYFGGLVSGTLIIIVACGTIFCVSQWTRHLRHMKKVDSPQVTEKTADIPMGTNQAYETVDVRYAAAGRGREQEEIIYETPAS